MFGSICYSNLTKLVCTDCCLLFLHVVCGFGLSSVVPPPFKCVLFCFVLFCFVFRETDFCLLAVKYSIPKSGLRTELTGDAIGGLINIQVNCTPLQLEK